MREEGFRRQTSCNNVTALRLSRGLLKVEFEDCANDEYDAAAIDEDEDEKEEEEEDSAQRAGRQCTYSSTGGGEESREWWNKGAPSVQLTPIVCNLKISQRYLPHS